MARTIGNPDDADLRVRECAARCNDSERDVSERHRAQRDLLGDRGSEGSSRSRNVDQRTRIILYGHPELFRLTLGYRGLKRACIENEVVRLAVY
jgi:hypothetical protein